MFKNKKTKGKKGFKATFTTSTARISNFNNNLKSKKTYLNYQFVKFCQKIGSFFFTLSKSYCCIFSFFLSFLKASFTSNCNLYVRTQLDTLYK